MKINAQTKVSEVIKASSLAIDALISISAKFGKLKNPMLRKMMAPRVNLQQAAKIGGVRIDDVFIVLAPLGFEVEKLVNNESAKEKTENLPAFVSNKNNADVLWLDVRPILAAGDDPLKSILQQIKKVKTGQTFCIINTFEPIPLIHLLEKKGYESYVQYITPDEIHSYFHKNSSFVDTPEKEETLAISEDENFMDLLSRYEGKMIQTDVRNMEMPLPMLTILELSEKLPKDKILYVHHKRVPVYLLPELESKGFEYFIHEVENGEVKLIIRHKL